MYNKIWKERKKITQFNHTSLSWLKQKKNRIQKNSTNFFPRALSIFVASFLYICSLNFRFHLYSIVVIINNSFFFSFSSLLILVVVVLCVSFECGAKTECVFNFYCCSVRANTWKTRKKQIFSSTRHIFFIFSLLFLIWNNHF